MVSKGLAYASFESPMYGARFAPHVHQPFTGGRLLVEFQHHGAVILVVDTHTGVQNRFWHRFGAEPLGEVVDCRPLREDRLLVLTHERLVLLELNWTSGEFRFGVLHRFPPSAIGRFEHHRRLIAPTAHATRFVFAALRDVSNAELLEADVNSGAVRPIGLLEFAGGRIGGLHVHAGRLHVVERDEERITRIHTLDPADGRVLRVVDVEDREEAGIARRRFSPAALTFHDHSAVFLEQLMVGERPDRVLQPRLCRLDLRSGQWSAVESPVVAEIASACWHAQWQQGVIRTGEPTDLLHADECGGLTLHVRISHSTANGEYFGTGNPTWTWRSYRLPGHPKSLLRTAFEALHPADPRPRPKNLSIDRIYSH